MDEYNKLIGKVQTKQKNIKNIKSKIKFIVKDEDEDDNEEITLENITSFEILEKAINKLFKNLKLKVRLRSHTKYKILNTLY